MGIDAPIGVFDSGVGGISALHAMQTLLPQEDFIYYGDTLHAPYGTKTEDAVMEYVCAVVDVFLHRQVKAIAIACNTASAVAAARLRSRLSIPVIAMEPALKPASEMRKDGVVLVLATPMTLKLPKFHALYAQYGEGAVPIGCPGLMELVEQEDDEACERYLEKILTSYQDKQVDAIVLGCTHYVFLKPLLQRMVPETTKVLDGNEGTARQLQRVLAREHLLKAQGEGRTEYLTSGDASVVIPQMQRLMMRMQTPI